MSLSFYSYFIIISIHALRGESDALQSNARRCNYYFNPRPPWGERPRLGERKLNLLAFQSTPSVGRATEGRCSGHFGDLHFNPRPPWGERRSGDVGAVIYDGISIHALRGESDYDGAAEPYG